MPESQNKEDGTGREGREGGGEGSNRVDSLSLIRTIREGR